MPTLSISDKFSLELLSITKEHLCDNDYSREQFELQILLTLSKNKYIKQLLFRDLSIRHDEVIHNIGGERIHDQAITYLYQVLGRRLRLARNLIDKPSNMHRLLGNLCRFSIGQLDWENINISRYKKTTKSSISDIVLQKLKQRLEKNIELLGENYSSESHRRREKYGPLYLIVGKYFIELPEEMSLLDVIDAVPKKLNPKFVTDKNIRNNMIRVVKSLNERYMLLRSCGLDINQWLESNELSIGNLRDMKRLKKEAERLLRNGEARSTLSAYRQSFETALTVQKKVAACKTFNSFTITQYGSQLMKLHINHDRTPDNDIEKQNTFAPYEVDHLEDTVIIQLDSLREVKKILSNNNDDIDDVMKMVFTEVVIKNRDLFNELSGKSLLNTTQFRALVEASPEYNTLTDFNLLQKIYHNAEIIIAGKLNLNSNKTDANHKVK